MLEPQSMQTLVILLAIAALNAYTAWETRRTRFDTNSNTATIKELEKNTNSIKDALVKVTREAAHSAGKEEGRVEGEIKAAALAQGRLP